MLLWRRLFFFGVFMPPSTLAVGSIHCQLCIQIFIVKSEYFEPPENHRCCRLVNNNKGFSHANSRITRQSICWSRPNIFGEKENTRKVFDSSVCLLLLCGPREDGFRRAWASCEHNYSFSDLFACEYERWSRLLNDITAAEWPVFCYDKKERFISSFWSNDMRVYSS